MLGYQQLWEKIQDLYSLFPQQGSEILPSREDGLSRTRTGHTLGGYVDSAQVTAPSLLRYGQQAHFTICLVKEHLPVPLHGSAQHFLFSELWPKHFLVPTSMLLCSACSPSLKLLLGLGAEIHMDGCIKLKTLQKDNY